MQSTFDERNWLSWLVRVRIFILTLLLAIELAVAKFNPAPLPIRLFVSTILFWFSLSLFFVLLLSFRRRTGRFPSLLYLLAILPHLSSSYLPRLIARGPRFAVDHLLL